MAALTSHILLSIGLVKALDMPRGSVFIYITYKILSATLVTQTHQLGMGIWDIYQITHTVILKKLCEWQKLLGTHLIVLQWKEGFAGLQ
jgi:hypothetical protein